MCQPHSSVSSANPSSSMGDGNHLAAAVTVRVLQGARGCAVFAKPCGSTYARTPPTRGHATTCRFPTTGEQRGLHIPPCQALVVLCPALEEAYFFGVHGEMSEEMILDFSRAWGGQEDVQGHGGAASH